MTSHILPILSATPGPSPLPAHGLPLLRLGFRPFYLGAALHAALAVPLWLAVLGGQMALPGAMPPLLWHAHEMLFGFAAAVIVGFLLTAGKAWAGQATPRGATLALLVALWLAARVAALAAPYAIYAALDVALLPVVAVVLGRVLLRAGNRRNLPLVGLLLLLGTANAVFHLAALGLLTMSPMAPLHAALALVVLIECVLAGRVLPAFTMGALPGLRLNPPGHLSTVALAGTAAGLAAWVAAPAAWPTAVLLAVAAVAHAALLFCWQPLRTRQRPILWILHAAYAWIPIGLMLLAWSVLGQLPPSSGIHALAVGATGGLVIGMITRTARGHTGRPLRVGRGEVTAYALVMVAALLRTLAPLPASPMPLYIAAMVAWSTAFAIYLFVYLPWLTQTRVDGKDG